MRHGRFSAVSWRLFWA